MVLAAVKQDGSALQHASEQMCADLEVVLAAVVQNGSALQWASGDMQCDRKVVVAAVTQDSMALRYASDRVITAVISATDSLRSIRW